MKLSDLKNELMGLIDLGSPFEIEVVERYVSLVKTYKDLDKKIKKEGYDKIVRNGSQTFVKINDAVGEKYKCNQQLIKLGEFFIKRIEEKKSQGEDTNFANPSDFL